MGPGQHAQYTSAWCERGEGLFCSGAAQVVCHALRVKELSGQLEVEEEDGDRREEEVEKREKSNQGECAMLMTMDGV